MHGPPNDLETYQNEGGTTEITLLTDEREEFEDDENMKLDADIIPDKVLEKLADWCRETDKHLSEL